MICTYEEVGTYEEVNNTLIMVTSFICDIESLRHEGRFGRAVTGVRNSCVDKIENGHLSISWRTNKGNSAT